MSLRSVALSSGSGAIAIAATVASNILGGKVESFISDDRIAAAKGNIKAASISLTSVDEAKISSFAIGASISGTTGTGSASIGVSIADNTLNRSALASIDGTASIDIGAGTLKLSASNNNIIEAKAIAASVAVTASTGSSFSLSGAGAKSSNVISGHTLAYIKNTDISHAGEVALSAANTSSLAALIVGVSVAASGGSGAAIGVAIAENKIGSDTQATKIQSYLEDSKVNASKILTLTSTANMDISAVVAAGSVAISAGTSAGLVGAGSGVSSTNDIYNDVASYIDNTDATGNTIQALGLALISLNASTIDTIAGSVSIGARVGSGGNATLVIGVALASNTIDNDTRAYILGVPEVNATNAAGIGSVTLSATSNNTITATSFAASLAIAIGSGGSASIAGAGADATNVINGTTAAFIKNSSLIGANQLTLNAKNTSKITAEVVVLAVAGAGGSGPGLGIAIGAALASNDIGTSIQLLTVVAYLENTQVTVAGLLNVQANNGMSIDATVVAGAMAVAAGSGPAGAGAGSGVDTSNNIYAHTLASIDNSSNALKVIKAGTVRVQATDHAKIPATAAAVSVAIAAGSGPALTVSVGVSIAENNIHTITTAQVIGKGSSISQTLPQISAGSLAVLAKDTSIIKADVVGASVSASVSGSGSLSLSVAAVLAENNVINAVTARIQSIDVETRNGGVEVNANENARVELLAAAASVSLAGGTVGIALSGAGVSGTN
ncbi:MAG: hypothetical protein MJK13_08500, partial [Pseudomonadales bacterium]|nr:hypothetical protein [Pseudomonadales bacterium]